MLPPISHIPPSPVSPINEVNTDDDEDEEPTNAGAHSFAEEATTTTTILMIMMNFFCVSTQAPGHLLQQHSTLSPPTLATNLQAPSNFKFINKKHASKANPGASDLDI